MCGIAGLMRFDNQPVHVKDVNQILTKLQHRGRDHIGVTLGSTVNLAQQQLTQSIEIGLGHRRLSIIDLSQSAAQPMFYADGNLCITYNGELYNYLELRHFLEKKAYCFTTHSDTEVLLAAYHYWGESCVKYFNGMFSFALWDEYKKQLFCARDPLGIKPFYYHLTPKCFAFASEAFALSHLVNQQLNFDAVLAFFLSMYVPGDDSIFLSIHKLKPGSYLTINSHGKYTIEQYWSLHQFQGRKTNSEDIDELTWAIRQAVKRQLSSDVAVGGFLSGGIDSGMITALAAQEKTKYYTYSVGYDGLPDNELSYAKQIANQYGTTHTEIQITSKEVLANLDSALQSLSEPSADPALSATYMLAEIAALDGVKVLLNGTGGDEIFAGYTRYTGELSLKRKLRYRLQNQINMLSPILPLPALLKARLQHPAIDMICSTGGSYSLLMGLLNHKFQIKQFLTQFICKITPSLNHLPLLYQQMLFDLRHYLPDELLFMLDQMTMAHTVEGRVPLLDMHVVQLAFHFDAHEHIKHQQTKFLLKKIARPYLGEALIQRKKQGFAAFPPLWVKQHYQHFLEVIRSINHIPYFENFNISSYIERHHFNARTANDMYILYCFCQWYEKIKKERIAACV